MKRILIAALTIAAAVVVGAQAAAGAPPGLNAVYKEEFVGASPEPEACLTNPGVPSCAVGHIARYGAATNSFTLGSQTPDDGCILETGTATHTLVGDPSSRLTTFEEYLSCTPGRSADANDSPRAFGNPFSANGTYEILSGTGVFAGAEGEGLLTIRSGGDALVIRYAGTLG